MKYTVKTRNWNGNIIVAGLLNAVAWLTGCYAYKYTGTPCDHDHKYCLLTDSKFRAWLAWGLFMLLRPFSGGWTYIIRPGADLDTGYKAIY